MIGPIIDLNQKVDIMMHASSCKTLYKYLLEGYDARMLEDMMLEYFGEETINSTKKELEVYYEKKINKIS